MSNYGKLFSLTFSASISLQLSLLADAINEMEKFEGELAVKRAGLQALRLNVSDPSTLMQLKGKLNPALLLVAINYVKINIQLKSECHNQSTIY